MTVNALAARITGGNPNAEVPQLVSVHLLVGGEEHSKEVNTPGANTQSVAMRFASTHFAHNSLVDAQGWAVFEYQEGLFSVPVDLQPKVYNVLGGWFHGDPGRDQSDSETEQEAWRVLFEGLAAKIASGYSSASCFYSIMGDKIEDLPKYNALLDVSAATGLVMVTHGNENAVGLCDGLNAQIETMSSGEMNEAWHTNMVTPLSHFAISYSCDTVTGDSAPYGSYFKQAFSIRSIGGAYLGFPQQVGSRFIDTSMEPPVTRHIGQHLTKLMEGLAAGMCARDAVKYANETVPGFHIAFVGDGLATLSSVYLTQSERETISVAYKPYPFWFKKL